MRIIFITMTVATLLTACSQFTTTARPASAPGLQLPQLTPDVTVTAEPYVIAPATATQPVYVRSGPSPAYAEWAILAVGYKFAVLGQSNGWWQVDLGHTISGWVDASIVDFKGDARAVTVVTLPTLPPPPQASATPFIRTPTAQATTLAQGVTLRLGTPNPSPDCSDHYPWFFDNPAKECAATLNNTWAVMQPFEHGLMIWSQAHGETFILIEDGSPFKPYSQAEDLAGIPNPSGPDPSLAPPAGLYQPQLGFAKFWRGLIPDYAWVRPALGWATAPEEGYSSFYQCNTETGSAARCYWSGPHDEIIALARGPALYWTYVKAPAPK